MAYVLSISYDPDLLGTRELLQKQMGHRVASAEGYAQATLALKRAAIHRLFVNC